MFQKVWAESLHKRMWSEVFILFYLKEEEEAEVHYTDKCCFGQTFWWRRQSLQTLYQRPNVTFKGKRNKIYFQFTQVKVIVDLMTSW